MALSLGVRDKHDIFIGNHRVLVNKIISPKQYEVLVGDSQKSFTISEEESTEILPDVRMSAGLGASMEMVRMVIEAPRSIKILRGHIYRKECMGHGIHAGRGSHY